MLKRLSKVILSAGFLLGVAPTAASAHDGHGRRHRDDHYRCMYRCRGDYYYRRGHRDRDHRYCWYRDRHGWYKTRCYRHRHYDSYGGGWYTGYSVPTAAPAAAPVVPFHAGHDHGPKPDKHGHKDKHHGDDHHHKHGGGQHHGHDDSAHASGGYDAHRSHDR